MTSEKSHMDVAEFLEHLDELFELDPGTLQLSSVLEEVPGWSSLTFLGLIALVDEQYSVAVTPRQINKCVTVGDLYVTIDQIRNAGTAA